MKDNYLKNNLVCTAKKIILAEEDLLQGIRKVCKIASDMDAEEKPIFSIFIGIDSETDHYPIGEVRQRCSKEYLERADRELKEYLEEVKEPLFKACEEIIDYYQQDIELSD